MLAKIGNLMKKNIKLLFRSKISSLIIVLGPLILVMLIGLAFSNFQHGSIDVSFYSESYSELSNNILDSFKDTRFEVSKETSEKECKAMVRSGSSHICVVLPPEFRLESDDRLIKFHVDYSKINLVHMLIDSMNEKISEQSEHITKKLTSQMIQDISLLEDKLDAEKNSISEIVDQTEEYSADIKDVAGDLGDSPLKSSDPLVRGVSMINSKLGDLEDTMISQEDSLNNAKDIVDDISGENISGVENEIDDSLGYLYDMKNQMKIDPGNETIALVTMDVMNYLSDYRNSEEEHDDLLESKINKLNSLSSKIASLKETSQKIESTNADLVKELKRIASKDSTKIAKPFQIEIESVSGKKTFFNFIFPGLLVLVIMITAILFSSNLVMSEKTSKAYLRNHMVPVSAMLQGFSLYLTSLLVVSVQLLVFVVVGSTMFDVQLLPVAHTLAFYLFLIISFFVLLGMLIGYLFKSESTSILGSVGVASLMLFFSDMILPLESMASSFRSLSFYNPFVLGEYLLKQTIFYKIVPAEMLFEIGILISYILISALITFFAHALLKTSFVFHYHRKKQVKEKPVKEKRLL